MRNNQQIHFSLVNVKKGEKIKGGDLRFFRRTLKNHNFDFSQENWGLKDFILKKFLAKNVQHLILSRNMQKSLKIGAQGATQ